MAASYFAEPFAPSDWMVARYDPCICLTQSDLNLDTQVDAVDLAIEIDVVFFGAPLEADQDCITARADFNADTLTDAVDLASLIDHVFFGGPGPADPCSQ